MGQYTITHSETTGGWTSFWSYFPDWFGRMGNKLYTFRNGQVWEHHDNSNALRNNFYGNQADSSVKVIFNDAMADDKAFKTLVLEGNEKWGATLLTNYTQGSLSAQEFDTKESRQFSFIRGNQTAGNLNGNSQGIGVIQVVGALAVEFSRGTQFVNEGDQLYQLNGSAQELIGTITLISGNVISVDAFTNTPVVGLYSYAVKNSRAEGGDIRGYFMEVLLTNTSTSESELFAVGTEVSKSYV